MLHRLLIEPFAVPYMQRALMAVMLLSFMGVLCGLHVVLRRLAFLTETLQHTVFPGVVVAFMLGQSLLLGAAVAAVLTVAAFTLVSRRPRLDQDSVLAVLVSFFFGVGVVLVSRSGSFQHDLTTLLFGRLLSVSRLELIQTAGISAVVVLVLLALHKELVLRAFDEEATQAMGYSVGCLDLVLNLVVACVVVASVRAVGTVLVIAFLVTPAATGRLLAARFSLMFVFGFALAALSGWVGLGASYELSVSHDVQVASGAAVVLLLTAVFLVGLVASAMWRRLSAARASVGKAA